MNGTTADRLYNLLPAVYRLRDAAQGEPLRALLGIIEDELDAVELDIAALYENWFIETCEEWVVPYIGDLLGTRPLYSSPGVFSERAYVAHTLSYRRRKGAAAMLEQLARDVTGWPARVVEFFLLLATTQCMNHIRLENIVTPDLRDTNLLELLGGPFEQTSHNADVRHIADTRWDVLLPGQPPADATRLRGKYNIPNLGLYLWRLQSYAVTQANPRPVTDGADGRYRFSPLGYDVPLFNRPQTPTQFTRLAGEINVPGTLRRRALYDELETRRQTLVDNHSVWLPNTAFALGAEIVDSNGNTQQVTTAGTTGAAPPAWSTTVGAAVVDGTVTWRLVATGFALDGLYFTGQPVLQILPSGPSASVPLEQIMICDLSDLPPPSPPGTWRQPPTSKSYVRSSDGVSVSMPIQVSVDPVLGRLAFAAGAIPAQPAQVRVSYSYGFSGDLGGGPYDRTDSVAEVLAGKDPWQVGVGKDLAPLPNLLFATLADAVQAWNAQPPGTFGVIAILDSRTYSENLTGANRIQIPAGSQLLIVAADWPALRLSGSGQPKELVPSGLRPHLLGDVSVAGTAAASDQNPGALVLNGLLIEGMLRVLAGNLGGLRLVHSTLVPEEGGHIVNSSVNTDLQNSQLSVSLERSIAGPITLPDTVPALRLADSIVDAAGGLAINAPGTDADIQTSTIFGSAGSAGASGVRTLEAGNSIFTGLVDVERRQAGCLRFCYLPDDVSRTPRRYRCQPDLALQGVNDPAVQAGIRARLAPLFTSLAYGQPGYAQLSLACAPEIRAGAEDGSEMGAFSFLKQPQREANLRASLPEYLRFGLELGIFYVT